MRIVAKTVVDKHWYLEAYQSLQVTLAVGGADIPVNNVVMITHFLKFRFILYKLVTAGVAKIGIIIFILLPGTEARHCPIRL